mmetsp:Transcript_28431/g.45777  ORF Transcript_28431/g.45777 Transcript_28431/m.45777 type:complete len:160 (+) Transcript_28431:1357-1836(+)
MDSWLIALNETPKCTAAFLAIDANAYAEADVQNEPKQYTISTPHSSIIQVSTLSFGAQNEVGICPSSRRFFFVRRNKFVYLRHHLSGEHCDEHPPFTPRAPLRPPRSCCCDLCKIWSLDSFTNRISASPVTHYAQQLQDCKLQLKTWNLKPTRATKPMT